MSDAMAVATAVQRAVEQRTGADVDVRGFARGDGEVEVTLALATDAGLDVGDPGDGAKSQDGGGAISVTRDDVRGLVDALTPGGGEAETGESEPETVENSVSPMGAPRDVDELARAALDTDPGEPVTGRGSGEPETGESDAETDDFECLNDGCSRTFEGAKARNGHMATCDAASARDPESETGESASETDDLDRFDYIRANGPCVAAAGPDTDAPCGFGAHEAGDPYCPKHRALADERPISRSEVALAAHDAWAHGEDARVEAFIERLKA